MSVLKDRIGPWLKEALFDVVVNRLWGSSIIPRPLRWRLLRVAGMNVQTATIGHGVYFGTARVEIGPGVQIGPGAWFDGAAPILLRPRSGVGPRSMIITGAHELGGPEDRVGPLVPQPVDIGEGVWIGAGVIVLPGVTVGAGCVIGAGAVVVRDCEPHGLYVGSPARRLRDLDQELGVERSARLAESAGPRIGGTSVQPDRATVAR